MSLLVGLICGSLIGYGVCFHYWEGDRSKNKRDLAAAREDAHFWKQTAEIYGIHTAQIEAKREKNRDV